MLTELQRKNRLEGLAAKIAAYVSANGSGPTIREISGLMGIRSLSVAHRAVKELEDAGMIERESGKYRSIRIPGGIVNL